MQDDVRMLGGNAHFAPAARARRRWLAALPAAGLACIVAFTWIGLSREPEAAQISAPPIPHHPPVYHPKRR